MAAMADPAAMAETAAALVAKGQQVALEALEAQAALVEPELLEMALADQLQAERSMQLATWI